MGTTQTAGEVAMVSLSAFFFLVAVAGILVIWTWIRL